MLEMHTDYKNDCEEMNKKAFSYMTYWRAIKNMNISFAKLGVEECEECDSFKIHKAEVIKEQKNENDDINTTDNGKGDDDDIAAVARKKSRKSTDMQNNELFQCSPECDICKQRQVHVARYRDSPSHYNADKEAVKDDNYTVYLSSDMQKVMLLVKTSWIQEVSIHYSVNNNQSVICPNQ